MVEELLETIQENPMGYKGYLEYAKYLENTNLKQAYLTYENALYFCEDELIKKEIQDKLDEIEYRNGKVEPASIVILSYNNRALTQQCIESIRETTPEFAREIVIVDNDSKDDSVEYLRQQKDIVLVENDYNSGFPGGCNIGIKASKPENDIFLLNNDTIMCFNTLYTLRMGLYEKENYGAAGCVAKYSLNDQVISNTFLNMGINDIAQRINLPGLNTNEIKVVLIGFAVLIKRDVLEKTGYLDERFFPGNKEDEDLSLRILANNYQNVLVHNSFIEHLGGQSFNKLDRAKIQYDNIIKFNKKYGFPLEYSGNTMYSEQCLRFYESKLKDSKIKLLDVCCEMGARLTHLAFNYQSIEFYGLDNSFQCATISRHLDGVHIEHYFDIEDNPFQNEKFDFIAFDSAKIDKSNLEKYLNVLKGMLNENGQLEVLVKNESYYKNWYPMIFGKMDNQIEDTVIFGKDLDFAIKQLDLKIMSWTFYFESMEEELKTKLNDIQNIVGEDKHIMVKNIAYSIHC